MSFDPDNYVSPFEQKKEPAATSGGFNPDNYVSEFKRTTSPVSQSLSSGFNPDSYKSEFVENKPTYAKIQDPNSEYFKAIENAQVALGRDKFNPKVFTPKEYVDNYLFERRLTEWNDTIKGPELARLYAMPKEQKAAWAKGQRVFEDLPDFYKEGGTDVLPAVGGIVTGIATDITTWLSFGTTKLAMAARKAFLKSDMKAVTKLIEKEFGTSVVTKEATDKAIEASAKRYGIGAGLTTEIMTGASGDIKRQKLKQQTQEGLGEKVDPLDYKSAAAWSVLGGVLGTPEVLAGAKKLTKNKLPEKIAEAEKKIAAQKAAQQTQQAVPTNNWWDAKTVDETVMNMDEQTRKFVDVQARQILDQQTQALNAGKSTTVFDTKTASDISRQLVFAAGKVIKDSGYVLKQNEKISDLVERVIKNNFTEVADGTKISADALERAFVQSGITPDGFAAAMRGSVSDAARTLQAASAISKGIKRLEGIDPAAKRKLELMYPDDADISKSVLMYEAIVDSAVNRGWNRVNRESKAWITSPIATSMRNIYGTAGNIGFKAASDILNTAVTGTYRAVGELATGGGLKGAKTAFSQTADESLRKSWDTFLYLSVDRQMAEAMTTLLTEHNPTLRNRIINSVSDTDIAEVTRVGRAISSINAAQDQYFRQAVFTASVKDQLAKVGIDIYDVMAGDKLVPTDVLQRAADEAVKATFSYMPRASKGTTERLAATAVNFVEQVAPLNTLLPFSRFMVNVVANSARYSPAGTVRGGKMMLEANKLIAAGNKEAGERLMIEGRDRVFQGLTGSALFGAAFWYRANNQDTKPSEIATGNQTVTDLKSVYPFGQMLILADAAYKGATGADVNKADVIESLSGLKNPGGVTNIAVEDMIALFKGENDPAKFAEKFGQYVGALGSRFTQPSVAKELMAWADAMSEGPTLARDTKVVDKNQYWYETMAEAFVKPIVGKLPIAKEKLPAAVERMSTSKNIYQTVNKDIAEFTGIEPKAEASPAMKLFNSLGIDSYRLFGKSSGNTDFDKAYILKANEYVLPVVNAYLKDKEFMSQPSKVKVDAVYGNGEIRKRINQARQETMELYKKQDPQSYYRVKWFGLSDAEREIINSKYASEHGGRTVDDNYDYEKIDAYMYMTKRFDVPRADKITDQTNRAFSR